MKKFFGIGFAVAILLALSSLYGCDGDSTSSTSTTTGVFRDSNVSGLEYTSDNISGITENGQFQCKKGKQVTFKVGNVILGSTTCKNYINPADWNNAQDIAEFLQALDSDSNPKNGINISEETRKKAKNWSADVDDALLDAEYEGYVPPKDFWENFKNSFYCTYSGVYKGKYGGYHNGDLYFFVPSTGDNAGKVYGFFFGYPKRPIEEVGYRIESNDRIPLYKEVTFEADNDTVEFTGTFDSPDSVDGKWYNEENSEDNGTFSASRVDKSYDFKALYRFAYMFDSNNSPIVIDVMPDNEIVAYLYEIKLDYDGKVLKSANLYKLSGLIYNDKSFDLKTADEDKEIKGKFYEDNITIELGTKTIYGCRLN